MEIQRTDDAFAALLVGISNVELHSMEKEFDALVAGIAVDNLNKMEDEFDTLFGGSNNSNNNNNDQVKKQCCDPSSSVPKEPKPRKSGILKAFISKTTRNLKSVPEKKVAETKVPEKKSNSEKKAPEKKASEKKSIPDKKVPEKKVAERKVLEKKSNPEKKSIPDKKVSENKVAEKTKKSTVQALDPPRPEGEGVTTRSRTKSSASVPKSTVDSACNVTVSESDKKGSIFLSRLKPSSKRQVTVAQPFSFEAREEEKKLSAAKKERAPELAKKEGKKSKVAVQKK